MWSYNFTFVNFLSDVGDVGDVKIHLVNIKVIQLNGSKYRVQKRVNGNLRRWIFNTLEKAVQKCGAILNKVASEWRLRDTKMAQNRFRHPAQLLST